MLFFENDIHMAFHGFELCRKRHIKEMPFFCLRNIKQNKQISLTIPLLSFMFECSSSDAFAGIRFRSLILCLRRIIVIKSFVCLVIMVIK